MNAKIKVLKDTPFDLANTILSLEVYKVKYRWLINTHYTDDWLIKSIKEGYKVESTRSSSLDEWFEVIEESNFKIGDWVWNEVMPQAICIGNSTTLKPNECTLETANSYPKIYKRFANTDEIRHYSLTPFCNGAVLIGKHRCYYFDNVWKELQGVKKVITNYLDRLKDFDTLRTEDNTWSCLPDGIIVGCKKISHKEVIEVAKHLFLI